MSNEVRDSKERAELLRVTKEQVEELAPAGDSPGVKIGRSWLFVHADRPAAPPAPACASGADAIAVEIR